MPTLLAALDRRLEELACHDASCAPPPVGTGGSRPGGASGGHVYPNGANPSIRRKEMIETIREQFADSIDVVMNAADTGAAIKEALEDGHLSVRIRISRALIDDILLKDQELKTQHDTGTSGGYLGPEVREEHEQVMFGAEGTRPIYGYLNNDNTSEPSAGFGVSMYGEVSLVLKKEVHDRVTFTTVDSLYKHDPPAPLGLNELKGLKGTALGEAILAASPMIREGHVFPSIRGQWSPLGYYEAQIHGGVTKADIAEVLIPGGSVIWHEWANDLREAGYTVRDTGKSYDDYGLIAAVQRRMEELACHSKECAPPPIGKGGSLPAGAPSAGAGANTATLKELGVDVTRWRSSLEVDIPTSMKTTLRAAGERLREDIESGEMTLRMRVPEGVLGNIIEDNQFKNQHEAGNSLGFFDPTLRDSVEVTMFGDEIEDYPVYGYFGKNNSHNGIVNQYGAIMFEMKPHVMDRTTMTLDDSLMDTPPAPITVSEIRSLPPGKLTEAIAKAHPTVTDKGNIPSWVVDDFHTIAAGKVADRNAYLEAQIHGRLTLDDVARVKLPKDMFTNYDRVDKWIKEQGDRVTNWERMDHEAALNPHEARRQLEERGITVEVYDYSDGSRNFSLTSALERRLEELACHTKECAPPPIGRGGSLPSGPARGALSPTAEGRVKPSPEFSSASSFIRHYGTEAAAKEAIQQAYSGPLVDGFHAASPHIVMFKNIGGATAIEVQGRLATNDGSTAGIYKRELLFEKGEIVAHHNSLTVHSEHQGKGIAQAFNDRLLKFYDEIGVDRIELEAALAVGPYAWAVQGYRFDGSSYFDNGMRSVDEQRAAWVDDRIQLLRKEANKAWSRGRANEFDVQEMNDYLSALNNASKKGADVQPIHIASIGQGDKRWTDSEGHHIGRKALTGGEDLYQSYYAVYYLGRPSQLD